MSDRVNLPPDEEHTRDKEAFLALHDGLLKLAGERIIDLAQPAYVKDCELRHVVVNAPYAGFFGLSPDDIIGKTLSELLGRQEDRSVEEQERRALVFGEEAEALCFAQGTGQRACVAVERFLDEDDSIYVFGEFMNPLSETGPASMASKVQRAKGNLVELFAGVIDDLPSPTFLRDSDHKMLLANKAYCALLGMSQEELVGKTEVESLGPEVGKFLYDLNQSVLDDGMPFENEEAFGKPGGAPIPVLSSRRRVTDADGKHYLLGALTDLSELRKREKQLGLAKKDVDLLRAQVEDLMRAMPVGILLLDQCFTVEFANETFMAMWGVKREEELVGYSYLSMIVESFQNGIYAAEGPTAEEIFQQRKKQLEEGQSGGWELERRDGTSLSVRGVPLETGQFLLIYVDVSDLRKRERESALFKATIEHMPLPIFLRDQDHRLIFVNQAYEAILGKKRDNLYGLLEQDLFPHAGERMSRENSNVLKSGKSFERQHEFKTSDGRMLSAITRINRITAPDQRQYLVGSIADVSDLASQKKELMRAQAESERLHGYLEGIMRTMPVGLLVMNEDLVIEFANDKVYEIWDVAAGRTLEGISFRDFSHTNYRRGWTWMPEESFEQNFQERSEELSRLKGTAQRELVGADGKAVVVTSKRLVDGKILIIYANMSEARQREREITEARVQLERLGQLMQDATRVMSQGLAVVEDGLIAQVNSALIRMLNVPAHILEKGTHWNRCFAYCAERGDLGEEPDQVLSDWRAHIQAAKGFSHTFLADGRTWVQMEATVSDEGHSMIVFTDISEMKQREEELKTLLARAETADRVKSEFLANMSHEIRTPMNGVLGMAELLSKSLLDTRQKTFVDIIVKSGNALLTIINDILDFSKIDAGQLKLRKAPFDPVEAIEDVATLLSASASEKDIELIVRGDATLRHMLVGDAGRFRQIVTNLVGNAIKFTETGHVLIEISSEMREPEEVMLSLRIEDTGIGIAKEQQASIFEKFSQVDASSTRRHEGTGLGLAITAGLVSLFGGRVDLKSEVGEGAVFTVQLPFPVANVSGRREELPLLVQDARVLVIDDNAINREILTEQLSGWGFDGLAVESGRTALAILDEAARVGVRVDAMVIDYHMPEMNGVDLARAIRADKRFDDISIIFLTSMDMVGEDAIFEELNIQAHLMKPARANILRGAIIDVTRTARLKRAALNGDVQLGPQRVVSGAAASDAGTLATSALPQEDLAKPQMGLDVLVAEDNDVNQIVFTQILQATGLRFKIVPNGKEAVSAWEREDPRLILMDVSMPVMNGHEAARMIRKREEELGSDQHVPIVGVTAHALDTDRDACLAAGMDDYLSKPISPELLEQKMGIWLTELNAAADKAKRGN